MTDDEHADMIEVGNKFWLEFSELCNRYIEMAPAHLHTEYVAYLGDKTSIYGRKRRG